MRIRLCAFALAILAVSVPGHAATVFKIATLAPEGTAWMREMRAAGDAIKAKTEGRVEFKYYPGGVMGNDATVLRKIRVGQLQGGGFTGSELASVYPDVMIYGLPFLFRNQAEVDAVRARMDPLISAGLADKGLIAAGITGGGFAYLLSTKPIRGREDLIQSKPWVPQGDVISEVTYAAAGVNPVPLSIADVYTGLQTGLVDTVANTPSGTLAFQWHTRVRHLVDMPIAYIVGVLALDKRTFDRLDPADQAAVMAEVGAGLQRLDDQTVKDNENASEALRKEGIEFFKPNAEELAYWQSVGETAAKELMDRGTFSKVNYDAMMAALAAARGQ
jgi:TRAP-type C4-dicarboxylate transport system substrate-binding protein